MSKASKKYAKIARAKYKELPGILKNVPLAMNIYEDGKEGRRLKKLRPTENLKYLDSMTETFLQSVRGRYKPVFLNRLLAVQFLAYNFEPEQIKDSTIANLQTLLTEQFRRGVEASRRRK